MAGNLGKTVWFLRFLTRSFLKCWRGNEFLFRFSASTKCLSRIDIVMIERLVRRALTSREEFKS